MNLKRLGGRRGERVRIADYIYEDKIGISAIAKVGRRQKEKRFPRGTSLKVITAWQEKTRVNLRGDRTRVLKMRGTLEGDVQARLAELPDGQAKNNTTWELSAWLPRLGTQRREKITKQDLQQVVNEWIAAGIAASTINHRRRALAQLYDALDGEDAPNPARKLKRVKEVLPEPTAYPMDVLTAIIDGMDSGRGRYNKGDSSFRQVNKSQARLRLLLWSGMPPISLRTLQPRRVAFEVEAGRLWYPPRGKGAGADAKLLPLFPEGAESVRRWLRARAHGTFSQGSLRKALQRAARAYALREADEGQSSPVPHEEITPYDLRHSFLTWLYETTGDPYLVQMYGQHADLETTARYTRKGVPTRALEAVAKVAGQQR